MIKFALYWHTETDDIELGRAYADFPPTLSTTVVFSSPEADSVLWRVVAVQLHPAMPGSMTVKAVEMGRSAPDGQVGIYDVFVEPTEGMFHAAPAGSEETPAKPPPDTSWLQTPEVREGDRRRGKVPDGD